MIPVKMFYKEMIIMIGFVILALLTVPILFYSIYADISMKEPPNWQVMVAMISGAISLGILSSARAAEGLLLN